MYYLCNIRCLCITCKNILLVLYLYFVEKCIITKWKEDFDSAMISTLLKMMGRD
jgi:hypothetical protein